MGSYSKMTFGTGGKAGTITPISKAEFQAISPSTYAYTPAQRQAIQYTISPGYNYTPIVRSSVPSAPSAPSQSGYMASKPATTKAQIATNAKVGSQVSANDIKTYVYTSIDDTRIAIGDTRKIEFGKNSGDIRYVKRVDANTYVYVDNPSAKSSIATVSAPTTVHITNNLTRTVSPAPSKTITFRDVTNSGQVVNQGKSIPSGAVVSTVKPVASVSYSDVPTGSVTDKAPVIEYDGYPYLTADQLRGPGWMTSVDLPNNHYITVFEEEDGSLTYYDKDKSTGETVMYPSETSKYNADGSLKKASSPTSPTAALKPSTTTPPTTAVPTAQETVKTSSEPTTAQPKASGISKTKPDDVLRTQQAGEQYGAAAPAGQGSAASAEDQSLWDKLEDAIGFGDESKEEPTEESNPMEEVVYDGVMPSPSPTDAAIPAVDKGVVGGGIEDPKSPLTETVQAQESIDVLTSRDTVTSDTPAAESVPASDIIDRVPRTEEDKREVTALWLDQNKEALGIDQHDVFTLATHFYPWAAKMYQDGYDLKQLSDIATWYDGLINNDPDAFNQLGSVSVRPGSDPSSFQGFASLSPEQQQDAILDFNKEMLERGIPPEAIVLMNNGIYAKLGESDAGDDTRYWMTHDGIIKGLQSDWSWNITEDVKDFLNSKEGLALLGGGAMVAGIGVGFLAAGPLGAAAGAKFGATAGSVVSGGTLLSSLAGIGTLPFAITELPQTFIANPFAQKQVLQQKNQYGKDIDSEADQLYNNFKSATDSLKFNTDTDNPQNNINLVKNAEQAKKQYEDYIKSNAFYLMGAGTLDNHVNKLDTMSGAQASNAASYGADGSYDNPKAKGTKAEFQNMREGWKVEYMGKTYEGKGTENTEFYKKPVSGALTLISPEGERYSSETVRLFADGNDATIDIGSLIDKATSYGSKKSGSGSSYTPAASSGKTTVYLPPGVETTYDGKTYKGGDTGIKLDFKRFDNAPLRLTFKASDGSKKELTEYIGYPKSGYNYYQPNPDLKGSTTGTVEGFQTYLDEGSRLYWQDLDITKYIDPETGLVAMPGPGYYNISVVDKNGNKVTKNIYVGEGTFNTLGLAPIEKEPFVPYSSQKKSSGGGYSGGGGYGGGGGSYGGGDYGGGAQQEEQALIIYGETCRDAEIWQDDVQVYPEIGVEYGIDKGYHAIVVKKVGKKTWQKTVFAVSGDTLTVSPLLEDDTSTTTVPDPIYTPPDANFPKRVFINSDPSGGKVLVNGSASGQWTPCYLDLPEGYYTFTIDKNGYESYDILCYVGEIIAWNQQATDLAKGRGWI